MPSPFPGMNPYLEQEDAWHDFHERYIPLVASTLGSQLRPSNKQPGPDREQYVAKRLELLGGPVHLVEIDLLRGGLPLPAAGRPGCSYSVLVSRVERRLDADFWPIMLRERLPVIPTPVRASPSRNAPLRPVRSIAQAKPLRSFAACRRSGRISS